MGSRPWLSSYDRGVPADVDVPAGSLVDLLDSAADRYPDRPAVSFLGTTLTYAQLRRQVDAFAGGLARLSVGAGDRVGLALPNCPQHVVSFFAVLRLGGVVAEINPLYTEPELVGQLADCGAETVVCLDRTFAAVHGARASGKTNVREIVVTSIGHALPVRDRVLVRLPVAAARRRRRALFADLPPGAPRRRYSAVLAAGRLTPHDRSVRARGAEAGGSEAGSDTGGSGTGGSGTAVLMYTTGTTGPAKGAMLTHRSLLSNAVQCRAWLAGVGARDGAETVLGVLPLFHAFGLTTSLTQSVRLAAHLVLVPKFDVDLVFGAIARYRPTIVPGVPPIFQALLSDARVRGDLFADTLVCLSGAMRLPPKVAGQWLAATGRPLVEGYGLTEASPVTHATPVAGVPRPGWIGVPLPSTEARVVDPADPSVTLAAGEAGQLAVRGPQVFGGYWNRPEATRAAMTADGWLLTGDLVLMDGEGWFQVVDRLSDIVVVAGFNVYPAEVAEVLTGMPEVVEVAVGGVPDPFRGETVKAVLVLTPGAELTVEQVQAFAAERLAAYKIPQVVEFRTDPLPKTAPAPYGKPRRPAP